MATSEDNPTSDQDSSDNSSASEDEDSQVEWLATGREKRSTAGNRLRSMLATEEKAADDDSDLELLFAEDDDDAGFSDKDDAGSDANIDSSSDEEDGNGGEDDDMAGEKELERQAKEERRTAMRKRKAANDAIPVKFRKKVRIQPPAATPTTPIAPPPRPKKKSERASWIPTAAELPTRASARETTKMSKEQLHLRMIENEARSKKQAEIMERKAKRDALNKTPPLTQAERLKEAAIVERRNAKSLSGWEEAEKQREEDRRAKLAALHDRRLEGPVITFYSGIVDLSEGRHKYSGKIVSMEDKPRKKRQSAIMLAQAEGTPATETPSPIDRLLATPSPAPDAEASNVAVVRESKSTALPAPATSLMPPPQPARGPSTGASFLAPPVGMTGPSGDARGTPGYASASGGCLAAPQASHHAPPPMLNLPSAPTPSAAPPSQHTTASFLPITTSPELPSRAQAVSADAGPPSHPLSLVISGDEPALSLKHSISPLEPSQEPETTTVDGKVTRSCIIMQDFNDAIERPEVQTQVLFGRKMSKLAKPPHPPLCVITGQASHYKDPKTGLPYRDAAAYKQLKKVSGGEYKFSKLTGGWVGAGTTAARGTPARFSDPSAARA